MRTFFLASAAALSFIAADPRAALAEPIAVSAAHLSRIISAEDARADVALLRRGQIGRAHV